MSILNLPSFKKLEQYIFDKGDVELCKLLFNVVDEVLEYYQKEMLKLVEEMEKSIPKNRDAE